MLSASAGHRYFLGFLRGTSRVAILNLGLPIRTSGTKKRGIEHLHVFLPVQREPGLVLREKKCYVDCSPPLLI
jgi:hypothetical protein